MSNVINQLFEEWEELREDYKKLEAANEQYLKKAQELTALQATCTNHIAHQKYRIQVISKTLNKLPDDEKSKNLKEYMLKRETEIQDIEQTLPRRSDRYMLKLILGNIDLSFLSKENKFKYKDDYEKFKLIIHGIALSFAIILHFYNVRPLEKLFVAFLVWYYATISIRESILKVNGSRIKEWWRVHHLLSIASSSLLLIWPDNEPWALFRKHFIYYTIYSSFLQYLQFKYQRGTLYRLKSLGEMQNMDITVEGFHSWMWRGLTFLLPFLFIAYFFQLTNAYILFSLSYHPEATWEITALGIIFTVFFLGNTITTIRVIPKKTKKNMLIRYKILSSKFYEALSETVKMGTTKQVHNKKVESNSVQNGVHKNK